MSAIGTTHAPTPPVAYAIDTETWIIEPGVLAPPLVCVSVAVRTSPTEIRTALFDKKDGLAFVRSLLEAAVRGEAIIVLQNGVYDFGVLLNADPSLLSLIFEAYARGVIRDTKERQKLIDLADGNMKYTRTATGEFVKSVYTLEALVKRHTGRQLDKSEDSWRLRYKELDGVPLDQWEERARRYPMEDAGGTLETYEHQNATPESPVVKLCSDGLVRVTNEEDQLRAHWALHLQSIYGIVTDVQAVAKLKAELEKEQSFYFRAITRYEKKFKIPPELQVYKVHNFQRGTRAGTTKISRNMAAIQKRVLEAFKKQGVVPPLTEGGLKEQQLAVAEARDPELDLRHIQTSGEALRDSGDPVLKRLEKVQYGARVLSTYIPALENGTRAPMNVNYNLLLETGRTSCPEPRDGIGFNPQVLPRREGVRDCIIPREGNYLCSVDFSQVELCTLGETLHVMFGKSSIADAINAGKDLHLNFAAHWLKIPYEEALSRYKKKDKLIKKYRQIAKVPGFGKPGGMGDDSLIDFAKATYNITLTRDEAAELTRVYFEAHPDMQEYFKFVAALVGQLGEGSVTQLYSGRVRGGATFCQACNTFFQGLAADGGKLACWRVARECYEGGMYIPQGRPAVIDWTGAGDTTRWVYVRPENLNASHGAIDFGGGKYRSPLWLSRPIAFIHDEILAELPKILGHEAAFRMSVVMNGAMQEFCPHVRISSVPAIMERWYKGAEDAYDTSGMLIPWRPDEVYDEETHVLIGKKAVAA